MKTTFAAFVLIATALTIVAPVATADHSPLHQRFENLVLFEYCETFSGEEGNQPLDPVLDCQPVH